MFGNQYKKKNIKMTFAKNIEEYCAKYNVVFDEIYDEMLVFAKDKQKYFVNVTDYIVETMRLASEHNELHGFEKKELVVDVCSKMIEVIVLEDGERER